MNHPNRKRIRLANYDYSQCGAYFITICTQDRECLFGDVGADSISARMVARIFEETIQRYKDVYCSNYVVMPNHFHAIIVIERDIGERNRADMESAPTISDLIQDFKRHSTIEYIKLVKNGVALPFNKRVWQRSFHDHIIRNDKDYQQIYEYITNNPVTWESDCFR